MRFRDRVEAGNKLAAALSTYRDRKGVVLGLPRGGVVVAAQVAESLGWPLDVVLARKIPAPGNEEYAIGAVAETGEIQVNQLEMARWHISPEYIKEAASHQMRAIERRIQMFRGGKGITPLVNRIAIVVDDGVATGFTLKVALAAVRAQGAQTTVAAIPVGPPDTVAELAEFADEVVTLATPDPFYAVGLFYEVFDQTTDEEVIWILRRMNARQLPKDNDGI